MLKFSFATLNHRAEAHKNFKIYLMAYYEKLKEQNPKEKSAVCYRIIAEKFGMNWQSVGRIVRGERTKINFVKPMEGELEIK